MSGIQDAVLEKISTKKKTHVDKALHLQIDPLFREQLRELINRYKKNEEQEDNFKNDS